MTTVVSLISWKKVSSEKYKVDAGIYFDSLYDRVYERIREPLTSSRILASNFRTAKKIAKERNLTDEESILVHISFLRNLQKDFQYDRVYIVDNSNKKYIYNGGIMPIHPEANHEDRWYKKFVNSGEEYKLIVTSNRIFVDYRIEDESGNFLGVCGVGISLSRLNSYLEDLVASGDAKDNAEISLLNSDGEVLSSSNPYNLNKVAGGQVLQMLKSHHLPGEYIYEPTDSDGFVIMQEIEPGLFLLVRKTTQIQGSYYELIIQNISAYLLILIISMLFINLIMRRHNMFLTFREMQQARVLSEALSQAESSNVAKSKFLAYMSHDIRTPMNGILGMTAIAMANLDDSSRIKDCLQKIASSSQHLLNIVNEVLDMSKIETGNVELVETDFDLRKVLENIVSMVSSQVMAHRHSLKTDFSKLEHYNVVGDSTRIQQILINFLSNAIKYTPDGGEIFLGAEELPVNTNGQAGFVFVCQDNGIGMTQEFVKNIFMPFAREKTNTIDDIPGTGLGMAITRNLVHMMGGNIDIVSKPGNGSKFTITIYLKLADEVEDSKESSEEKVAPLERLKELRLNWKRILIVEDNDINAEILVELLRYTGVGIDRAENGIQAVEMVECNPELYYDLVLMDIQMPRMSGYDAARAIRAVDRLYNQQLPIVAVTANAFTDDVVSAKNAGMNDHLAKPIDIEALVVMLEKWLLKKNH